MVRLLATALALVLAETAIAEERITTAFADLRERIEARSGLEMDDVMCSDVDCVGFVGEAVVQLYWPDGASLRVSAEPLSPSDTGPFIDGAIAVLMYMTGAEAPEAEGILMRGLDELDRHERAAGEIAGAHVEFRRTSAGTPSVDIRRPGPP